MSASPGLPRPVRSLTGFLRRHPIVCLLLLTPGIPEFLSGSTSIEPLVLNPPGFLLSLVFDLALYGPGVLLIREAMVRGRKGWASVVAWGAAYAIVEEGIAVDTFFYPKAGPVGALGFYGHWLGVSWVWVTGIIMVHVFYSIGLPILLHGWALPGTRGRPLLTRRGLVVAILVLVADVGVLEVAVSRGYHFFFGIPLLVASCVAVAALVGLGYALPADLLAPSDRPPRFPRWTLFLAGLGLLPGTFVLESAHGASPLFPTVTVLVLVAFYAGLLLFARRALGPPENVRGGVAFALGAILPLMVIGVVANRALPIVLVADAAAFLFLRHLWRKYPDPVGEVPIPGGGGARATEAARVGGPSGSGSDPSA